MIPGYFDEVFQSPNVARKVAAHLAEYLGQISPEEMEVLNAKAELSMSNQGITFTVYADERGTEKIFPLDLIPRILTHQEWAPVEKGIVQRLKALNLFLRDVYNEQEILKDQVVPAHLVVQSNQYCREMTGIKVPKGVHTHIGGVDLIRNEKGEFLVLEDNLRCPSGVSYMLNNRRILMRVLPKLFHQYKVRSVNHYPQILFDQLTGLSKRERPNIAVLTPGVYNSAYFEHAFLADQLGGELVEGQDLLTDRDVLYRKTTRGLIRVDILYTRVDEAFIDPLVFRPDSYLGVPGLMHVYRAGNLVLANAPGNGVADDKAMYAYTPEIIKYYLNEEPILPIVKTYLCARADELDYVLNNLEKLVVKPTDASGGYGLLVGSAASEQQMAEFRVKLAQNPTGYIAQPIQKLSTHPTFVEQEGQWGFHPRHIDLRPYAVCGGESIEVIPGGLTRVALRQGSLVVNSSQGGGSKDTWVLQEEEASPC